MFTIGRLPFIGLIEEAEIDVASKIEFVTAELAHAEYGQPNRGSLVGQSFSPAFSLQGTAGDQSGVDRCCCDPGDLLARLVHVGEPKDLPECNSDHMKVAKAPQSWKKRLEAPCVRSSLPESVAELGLG